MAVVSKPLNPQKIKGYQLKDNVHTFHLIPSGTLCDHWSGHRDALKTGPILYKNFFLQRVDGFPYVQASIERRTFSCQNSTRSGPFTVQSEDEFYLLYYIIHSPLGQAFFHRFCGNKHNRFSETLSLGKNC